VDNDLTEGWPDEPDRAEVERFAAELRARLPALPEEALARVGVAVRRAAGRRRAWRWAARTCVAAGLAAAVLLPAALALWMRPRPHVEIVAPAPALVEDRYEVEYDAPPVAVPQRALVRIDEQQSLFTE
jgi:hypothetical protein